MRFTKPSPSMVVASIALFVSLGGTSVAAVSYARNAGKVDGYDAVKASSSTSKAAGNLVAANKSGPDKGRIPGRHLAGVAHTQTFGRLHQRRPPRRHPRRRAVQRDPERDGRAARHQRLQHVPVPRGVPGPQPARQRRGAPGRPRQRHRELPRLGHGAGDRSQPVGAPGPESDRGRPAGRPRHSVSRGPVYSGSGGATAGVSSAPVSSTPSLSASSPALRAPTPTGVGAFSGLTILMSRS